MKRSWWLLIILLILLAAWLFVSQKEKSAMEELSYERDFSVEKIGQVGRIHIDYEEREPVDIIKKGDAWFLNDTMEIWKPTVSIILQTLRDLEVKYTPPKAALPGFRKDIDEFGIHVKVYNVQEDLMTAFSIGGVTPGEDGTFVLKEGSDQPFVVGIPYQEGTIRNRFFVDEEEWKNRWIFREDLESINKVSVDYSKFPQHSFVLERQDENEYAIARPNEEDLGEAPKILNRGKAEAYLMAFEKVGIEAYENSYKKRDSIRALPHFARITVETDSEVKWLKLYPINHKTGEVDLSKDFATSGQLFRYLGDYSSGDFVLIQHLTIGDALVTYSDLME
ncbi:MAG: DUF4340 domain-containing protein [Saprospiraceae bacterium]|nr:DUF4340 domain-containing protein [Saprospiraceae bacterium]